MRQYLNPLRPVAFLLKWININRSMDKYLHAQKSVGWNYLFQNFNVCIVEI